MPSSNSKTVKDLNPRSQAVKRLEMQVLRTLTIIEAFDQLDKGEDWTMIPSSKWRDFLDLLQYSNRNIVNTIWDRYKTGNLQEQVLDLYENLPPAAQQRREITNGINRLRKARSKRDKRNNPRPNAGG